MSVCVCYSAILVCVRVLVIVCVFLLVSVFVNVNVFWNYFFACVWSSVDVFLFADVRLCWNRRRVFANKSQDTHLATHLHTTIFLPIE